METSGSTLVLNRGRDIITHRFWFPRFTLRLFRLEPDDQGPYTPQNLRSHSPKGRKGSSRPSHIHTDCSLGGRNPQTTLLFYVWGSLAGASEEGRPGLRGHRPGEPPRRCGTGSRTGDPRVRRRGPQISSETKVFSGFLWFRPETSPLQLFRHPVLLREIQTKGHR